ncbi:MAG: ChaN family lipoprotein, partial [Flavobacteriales bacterium]|nr:ChaN family lipoprotein [Flavobacteriales bacterium]
MKTITFLLSLLFTTPFLSQDKAAYKLYDNNGKEIEYAKMIKDLAKADIVFFGELHNDPIAHWLELEVTKDLYANTGKKLSLGAEMYESDNQLILDEYLNGTISKKKFLSEMRLWPNNSTDYQPLVDFAKENELKFIASNVPRRYASLVFTAGFEGLEKVSNEGQQYFAPIPIEYDSSIACYANMLTMEGMGDHAMPTLPMAQALKDA